MLLCAYLGPGKRIKCPAALIVSQDHNILKLPLANSKIPQTYGPPSLIVGNIKGKSHLIPISCLTPFVYLGVNDPISLCG